MKHDFVSYLCTPCNILPAIITTHSKRSFLLCEASHSFGLQVSQSNHDFHSKDSKKEPEREDNSQAPSPTNRWKASNQTVSSTFSLQKRLLLARKIVLWACALKYRAENSKLSNECNVSEKSGQKENIDIILKYICFFIQHKNDVYSNLLA